MNTRFYRRAGSIAPRFMIALLAVFAAATASAAPAPGGKAPPLHLQDQNGEWHTLEQYAGQWVTLYFYPKDDTPGCTTEACAFRDDIFRFRALDVKLLGVSLDDVESHKEFAEKYHLPFPLLSDAEREAAKAYDVLGKFGPITITRRETFLIDPDGVIAKHYAKVVPEEHSAEVLRDVEKLRRARAARLGQSAEE